MRICILSFLCLLLNFCAIAQENSEALLQGKHYIDLNIRSLDRYAKRMERTQQRLLHKLKKKEQRLAYKLLRTDSVAYARLKNQSLSFDSISKLARHPDSATLASRTLKSGQKAMDSLKGVYNFLQSKAGKVTRVLNDKELKSVASLSGYDKELSDLQSRLAYDQYINDLTNKQANSLKGIAGNNTNVSGIQKDLYYAKARIAEWKKLADDPSKAEELALEYLQGCSGFDQSLNQSLYGNSSGAGMGNASSATDLEAMGYQTKRMMQAALTQKFGGNLQALQGSVGKEVGQWQSQVQGIGNDVKETRQSLAALKHTDKPRFRINPMKCLPFWQRVEKQYSFNTARATTMTDGTARPAILTLAGSLAYRQTPKLSIGLGIAGDLGLGQNWSSIRFSFEGIGARSFVTWEWQYGIGAYLGYERTWKRYVFKQDQEVAPATIPTASLHSKADYSEAVLLGLTKKYKINSRWNGAVQVLYDVWWADKGLRSPIVLRFVNSK